MMRRAEYSAEIRELTAEDCAYIDLRIAQLLSELSVNLNGKGGMYISEILRIILTDPSGVTSIADALRQVAERHQLEAESVRSAIRYTVMAAWMEGDPDIQFRYFGRSVEFKRGKPTESDFITVIAMRVRHDLRAYRKRRSVINPDIPLEMQ